MFWCRCLGMSTAKLLCRNCSPCCVAVCSVTSFFFSHVQVVSMGLYVGEQAYLRSSWNILDGFLVFVSLIDIVVSMAGGAKILGVLRVLRLLRTLRPLRYGRKSSDFLKMCLQLIPFLLPCFTCFLFCLHCFSSLQGDQQSSGSEAGSGDPHHFPQTHRQHRPHLLCVLHHLWHSWGAGMYDTHCMHTFLNQLYNFHRNCCK